MIYSETTSPLYAVWTWRQKAHDLNGKTVPFMGWSASGMDGTDLHVQIKFKTNLEYKQFSSHPIS